MATREVIHKHQVRAIRAIAPPAVVKRPHSL
jgi:hypothetical protein